VAEIQIIQSAGGIMKKKLLWQTFVLCSAIALTSCGGSSGTSEVQDVVKDIASGNVTVDDSGIVKGNDCLSAASAFNAVNFDIMRALPSPEQLDLDRLAKNIEVAKSVVPAAIATEFALFADTYGEVGKTLSTMAGAGGISDPANAAKVAELTQKLENKEFAAAMDRLGDFFKSECLNS
jgi:hypothetical protein